MQVNSEVLKLENEKKQLNTKLKQAKHREDILEREKENAVRDGVSAAERIKGELICKSFANIFFCVRFKRLILSRKPET